jgi:hypothetical protein
MRRSGMNAVAGCAVAAIATVAAPGMAGAKVNKKLVETAVTLNTSEDPSDPSGETHAFTGSLDVDPERKTCLKRELLLLAMKPEIIPGFSGIIANANSDASGNFDFGSLETEPGDRFQAVAPKKKKWRKGKKIVCRRGVSEVKSF